MIYGDARNFSELAYLGKNNSILIQNKRITQNMKTALLFQFNKFSSDRNNLHMLRDKYKWIRHL